MFPVFGEKDKESWESKAKGGYRPKKAVKNTEIDEFFSHVNGVFEIDKMEIVKKNFNLIRRRSIELVRSLEKLGEE